MKNTHIKILGAMLAISSLSFFAAGATAQAQGTDIVIGKSLSLASKIFNRELTVQISLPEDYEAGTASYAVLYDMNGVFGFAYDRATVELLARTTNMPNMIVVGVPPLDNGYVPTPFEDRKEIPAGADMSIRFLKEELIPFVEKNYRTNAFRALYGHSVGGLFTMYTLFNVPSLFTAYIAGSPWFQTNDQYWLKNIEKMAKERTFDGKTLFMTVGKGEAQLTIDTYKELEKWMNGNPLSGLTWKSAWLEGDHASMVGRNIYDGLTFIFSGWKIPDTLMINADVEALDGHLKTNMAKWAKYGFDASAALPEQMLNAFGYNLLNRKEFNKAIRLFLYNIKLFPKSFNALDSLAEAYLTMGDKENAIKFYKSAVELNPGDSDYAKRILLNSKTKLKELGVEN
jgi:hypothetical protein